MYAILFIGVCITEKEVLVDKGEKVVIFHGFTQEELERAIGLLSRAGIEGELIFAITTQTNLGWRLEELIDALKKEHKLFKERNKQ